MIKGMRGPRMRRINEMRGGILISMKESLEEWDREGMGKSKALV